MFTPPSAKIYGAGPSGCLLALALSSIGFNIHLYDVKNEEELLSRDRLYALTQSSMLFFRNIDIWKDLRNIINPFNTLSIHDSSINQSLVLRHSEFLFEDHHLDAIGWTVEHKDFMAFLLKRIAKSKNIETAFNQTNKSKQSYDYYFAVDGLKSIHKKEWGALSFNHRYAQGCLTFKALVRSPFKDRAFEIFTPDGPMAILPIENDLYQFILSAPFSKCKKLSEISPSYLLDKVSIYLPVGLEVDCLFNKPQHFPLFLSLSFPLLFKKKFLVGEAAHCVHPVGGQGLNLSIRDINHITLFLKKYQSKQPSVLGSLSYNFYRYIDVLLIVFVTDFLIRIFSNRIFLLRFLRFLTFSILKKFSFLRSILFYLMTYGLTNNL